MGLKNWVRRALRTEATRIRRVQGKKSESSETLTLTIDRVSPARWRMSILPRLRDAHEAQSRVGRRRDADHFCSCQPPHKH
jgi:hypothetical protein